jgi:hypothetical protein
MNHDQFEVIAGPGLYIEYDIVDDEETLRERVALVHVDVETYESRLLRERARQSRRECPLTVGQEPVGEPTAILGYSARSRPRSQAQKRVINTTVQSGGRAGYVLGSRFTIRVERRVVAVPPHTPRPE